MNGQAQRQEGFVQIEAVSHNGIGQAGTRRKFIQTLQGPYLLLRRYGDQPHSESQQQKRHLLHDKAWPIPS
jgi:hypothetical protein